LKGSFARRATASGPKGRYRTTRRIRHRCASDVSGIERGGRFRLGLEPPRQVELLEEARAFGLLTVHRGDLELIVRGPRGEGRRFLRRRERGVEMAVGLLHSREQELGLGIGGVGLHPGLRDGPQPLPVRVLEQ